MRLAERILGRLPSLGAELMWAHGHGLPDTHTIPPAWVRETIRRVGERGILKAFLQCDPSKASPLNPALSGQLTGLAVTSFSLLTVGSESQRRIEMKIPAISELRAKAVALAEASLSRDLKVKKKKAALPLRPATPEQQAEFAAGFLKGARAANSAGGDFENEPIFYMIGSLLWIFWEDVERSRNRRDVWRWLNNDLGVACSFGAVEKFCREVGLKLAPRGRAKKMLRKTKKA